VQLADLALEVLLWLVAVAKNRAIAKVCAGNPLGN